MPRQIIIKLLKTKGKEKILKAIRKKKKKKGTLPTRGKQLERQGMYHQKAWRTGESGTFKNY